MPNNRIKAVKNRPIKVKTRPRKKRNRARTRKIRMLVQPTTIAQMEKTLMTPMTSATPFHGYPLCRLDPFRSKDAMGIPDTSGGRKLVVDHRGYVDITVPNNGSFVMKTMPALPGPLWFKPLGSVSGMQVNGTNVSTNALVSGTGAWIGNWISPVVFPEMFSYTSTNPSTGVTADSAKIEITPPYSPAKARIVTQAFRFYSLGAVVDLKGAYVANNDRFALSDEMVPSQYPITISNWDNTTTGTFTTGNIRVRRLDAGTIPTSVMPGTVTGRFGPPMEITPGHDGDAYIWNSVSQQPYVLSDTTSSQNMVCSETYASGTPSTAVNWGVFYYVDPAWDSIVISFTGLSPGTVIRFEAAMCMEYQPLLYSTFRFFAKEQTQTNTKQVETVSKIAKDIPILTTLDEKQGIIRGAMKFIKDRTIFGETDGKSNMQLALGALRKGFNQMALASGSNLAITG